MASDPPPPLDHISSAPTTSSEEVICTIESAHSSPLFIDSDSETEVPEYKPWSPEPEVFHEGYAAWGRKYYGDAWFKQWLAMLCEKNKDKYWIYQGVLRRMESKKIDERKLIENPIEVDPPGYKPWTPEPEPWSSKEHVDWGRKHLGEEWYEWRLAFSHPEEEKRNHRFARILDQIERYQREEKETERIKLHLAGVVTTAASTVLPSTYV